MEAPVIVCPNCGMHSERWVEELKLVGCHRCGNTFDIDPQGKFRLNAKLPKGQIVYQPEWLQPGTKLKRKNQQYTVTCAYLYGVNWKEYDLEDKTTNSGYAEYVEWVAVSDDDDNQYFVIEQTDTSSKFQIKQPALLTKGMYNAATSTSRYESPDYGTATLLAMQGQDDDHFDQRVQNYRVVEPHSVFYSVEWPDKAPEAEYKAFQVHQIDHLELERWKERSPSEREKAIKLSTKYGYWTEFFGTGALAMFIILLFSVISSNSNVVGRVSKNFKQPNQLVTDSMRAKPPYTQDMGTYHLESNKAYSFNLDCKFFEENKEAELSFQVLQLPKGKPVTTISAQFYTESGRDSEGAYTESTTNDYFYFRCEETADYQVIARGMPVANEVGDSGTITVKIMPALMSRYFIVAFLILALAWLIFQSRWEYAAATAGQTVNTWWRGGSRFWGVPD